MFPYLSTVFQLADGVARFDIDSSEIKNHPLRPWFPEGRRLQIDADVIEQATGKRENVVDNSIYFTKSPFLIQNHNTPKYFKPALPFIIKVSSINLAVPEAWAQVPLPVKLPVSYPEARAYI